MGRLIATRVSDEAYAKIMGKCAGLGCSVYDYLKMLVESDIADTKHAKPADMTKTSTGQNASPEEKEIRRMLEEIRQSVEGPKTEAP